MGDIYTTLQSSYTNAPTPSGPGAGKYVAVDPARYEGSWEGKFNDGASFKVRVSNVTGFRAKVSFQSGVTHQAQDVLIKDNTFRIGDTKFTLSGKGVALVKNVKTDPVYNTTTLRQGYARRDA